MNEGKSVLVTGALRGIGRAISLRLCRDGYNVVLGYREGREEALEAFKAELAAEGLAADGLKLDIADRAQCKESLEGYIAEHPMFWGFVLNAGICRDNPFAAMDGDDWDSVLHTNLDGFYNVLSPLMLPFCKKRKGRIVVISSVSGIVGNRGQVNYSASKAGLIGAVKALATELAGRSITVNAIAPGIIRTDMIQGLPMEEMLKAVPMKRLGEPEEVAALCSFLLSSEAGYITRQVISINGGMV